MQSEVEEKKYVSSYPTLRATHHSESYIWLTVQLDERIKVCVWITYALNFPEVTPGDTDKCLSKSRELI